MSRIAFIGLGNMGLPMAINLSNAGHDVKAFDLSVEAKGKAQAAGIPVAHSSVEAATDAEVLITMLPQGEHVAAALLGPGSPIDVLAKGALVIEASSIDVPTTRLVHDYCSANKVTVIDAPVSGGMVGAEAGTLTFMVGGTSAALQMATPFLEIMGSRIFHLGEAGAGQVVKACNQMVFGTSLAAVAEAFVISEQHGIDPQSLFDVLTTSTGDCWAVRNFPPVAGLVEGAASNNDFKAKFSARLLAKDLGLAAVAAESGGVKLVVGKSVKDQFERLASEQGDLDCSSVIQLVSQDVSSAA